MSAEDAPSHTPRTIRALSRDVPADVADVRSCSTKLERTSAIALLFKPTASPNSQMKVSAAALTALRRGRRPHLVTIEQVDYFETKALAIDPGFLHGANDNAFCGGAVGIGALRILAQRFVVFQAERIANLNEFYHR